MEPLGARLGRGAVATGVLFVVLLAGALTYTATGGAARELLVQELLVNLVLVLGLQVFIGNTGILSFGHLAFAQIAAYGAALVAIPAATKASSLPDLPGVLGDVELGPFAATLVGVAVALVLGAVVGVAVARAGGLAATMITLAVLFVVDQAVKNWTELTRGAGGLSGVPRTITNPWLWVAALGALFVATVFRETRVGRFAVATREDEIAAAAIGIDRFWPRWTAWVVSIAIVGTAGALRVQAVGSTNPKQYTLDIGVLRAGDARRRRDAHRDRRLRRHDRDHGRQRDLPAARRQPGDRAPARAVPQRRAARRDAAAAGWAARRPRRGRVARPAGTAPRRRLGRRSPGGCGAARPP